MKIVYFYPNKPMLNPYTGNFIKSLNKYYYFINANNPSKTGLFDILKYIGKIDCIFLNWIEDLIDKRGGIVQSLFFIILVKILKIRRIIIVWTLHNKLSHFGNYLIIKRILNKILINNSDFILTHSSEGIEYAKKLAKGKALNIKYLPHPVQRRKSDIKTEPKWDIIIWGNIIPYKGIDKFLEYLFYNNYQNKYKILIIGKSDSEQYLEKLNKFKNENITIENRFINENELTELIKSSRIILFTYTKTSVLSSGVLMDSLGLGPEVIGPDTGAFADLAGENIIHVFSNFDELITIIDRLLNKKSIMNSRIRKFIEENSWENFAVKFHNWIEKDKNKVNE